VEHCKEDPQFNPGNMHHKGMYDWNEIDEEIANDIWEHTTVGPIGNMHVDEEAPIGFAKLIYDQADEELDDDNYDEVANEHG
jgi:hypothetical protein